MKRKDFPLRLTGLTAGPLGVSWETVATESDEARIVINFMEDRRVLFGARNLEDRDYCIESVIAIRQFLTTQLGKLKPRSTLSKPLKALRASCRKFLEDIPAPDAPYADFLVALVELRNSFGINLAFIVATYELEVEEELASIFPIR